MKLTGSRARRRLPLSNGSAVRPSITPAITMGVPRDSGSAVQVLYEPTLPFTVEAES